jgi:hypothetical protein
MVENDELGERVSFYNQLIPKVFNDGFPQGFKLKPLDWALEDDVIQRPSIDVVIDGTSQQIRPIGSLDVEFLSNDAVRKARAGEVDLVKNYQCGLKCPGCFSEESVYGDVSRLMFWQDVVGVVDDARAIGLSSVKFLGHGELFQNPDLFDILEAMRKRSLPFSIFTKAAELGDDEHAKAVYGHVGVETAEELVRRVAEYDNVRILMGFNSFFPQKQNKMVGSYNRTSNYRVENGVIVNRGVLDYTTKRDKALVNLVKAGFNDFQSGQRLSLIDTPAGLDDTEEVLEMYVWAAKRNIPLIIGPTMESGPKSIGLRNYNQRVDPNHQGLIEMMLSVYSRAIDEGILTLKQVMQEKVSAYIGTSPCNQVSNGLFMRLNGQIQLCPGRSDESAIYGNVHDTPIAKIWRESPNYKRTDLTNNWCAAKSIGMPKWIQGEVMSRLKQKYGDGSN